MRTAFQVIALEEQNGNVLGFNDNCNSSVTNVHPYPVEQVVAVRFD